MRLWLALLASLICIVGQVEAQHFPTPNPPVDYRSEVTPGGEATRQLSSRAVLTEWTLHKSSDGQHPDGVEQARLWLLNRARQDPTTEGIWLATSAEPDIASGRDFFGVNLELLQSEFAALSPKPPAAFDARLYAAARAHSEDLIARDTQDHNGQFDRITDAGFQYRTAGANVFSFAKSALNAHAALNIDWGGNDGSGMQAGRGHRTAIMAINQNFANVGIAAVPDNDPATDVGPLVMSDNFAEALANGVDHFNRFVVGTVWEDLNDNDRYDPGEGLADVMVVPDQGDFFAVTAAGGGYAIPITMPGDYQLTFSGGDLAARVTKSVMVDEVSVLVDHQVVPLPDSLVAAVLPSSRSVQVGTAATAFATIINTGTDTVTDCDITLSTGIMADFTFQTTDPATNAVIGTANTQVDIAGHNTNQSFVIAFTPTAAFAPTEVQLTFACNNTNAAPVFTGLNTLLLSASDTAIPDIVALAATLTNLGIVDIPGDTGTGVFSVATVNVGAGGSITASAAPSDNSLPVNVTLCETDPATGGCISAIGSSVTTTINANATPTFGIFVEGTGNVPFDPATNRVFVRFEDAGGVTRGSTSVAMRTR